MIAYNPSDYGTLKDGKFYRDLLSSMGISTPITVAPFVKSFNVVGNESEADVYYILDNLSVNGSGIVQPAERGNFRSLFHGNLFVSSYVENFAGATRTESSLTVPTALNSWEDYVFEIEDTTANTYPNVSRLYAFQSTVFQFLHIVCSGVGSDRRLRGIFTGVKIAY